ncbi:Hypothetical predicted protein [Olea europaea subsp. europaea]|uniref:NADP-dependent oxidoreductase domain-containing protein n=1 Tax=Olea europaea subsp. europaea TaxID=158383 RepID=A0A8S0TKF2_OLEEU|nr:Hypothetical predicted protein [Olea europaea subsp. europaea]
MGEKVELATKFGVKIEDGQMAIHGDPAYVRAACEASLKRLDIDCIDLYYQHRIDTSVPVEVTLIYAQTPFTSCGFTFEFERYAMRFLKLVPRLQPENLEHNTRLFERVKDMANRKGCTPSQLALAWVHHQGSDVCPIPGTTKIENFNDNIGELSVKLTKEDMAELESIASADAVKGYRCPTDMKTWETSDTPPLSTWKAAA